MNKSRRFLCISILIIAVCIMFVSCNSTDKIDDFRKKLEKESNCEIVMTMDVPVLGKMTMISKIDGNKAWTSSVMGSPETYTEIVGDKIITYTKTENGWDKTKTDNVEEDSDFSLLDGKHYEYSKSEKAYVLKNGASLNYNGVIFTTAKLTLEKNSAQIVGTAVSEGVTINITIDIKNIGSTKVELPR